MYQKVLFTSKECQQIIDDALKTEWVVSKVYTNEQGSAQEVRTFRKSHHTLITYNSESFYYKKVLEFLANNDVNLIAPDLEVMVIKYKEGDFLKRHTDKMERYQRRYAMITQLTHPSEYSGGELIFYDSIDKTKTVTEQSSGNSILYPVDREHEVKPLTSGSRYSSIIFLEEHHLEQKRLLI